MSPVSALTPKKQASLNDYTHLRSEIRAVISAGKARAQDAVERQLLSSLRGAGQGKAETISARSAPEVIITSTKSDKYDRYLADVYYKTKTGEQYLKTACLRNASR